MGTEGSERGRQSKGPTQGVTESNRPKTDPGVIKKLVSQQRQRFCVISVQQNFIIDMNW